MSTVVDISYFLRCIVLLASAVFLLVHGRRREDGDANSRQQTEEGPLAGCFTTVLWTSSRRCTFHVSFIMIYYIILLLQKKAVSYYL